MPGYFTEEFQVTPSTLEQYGAFDISLVTDLPLFIDPFLLFNSKKPEYKALHEEIIEYLKFLRLKAEIGEVNPALLSAWYRFSEVKQTWLGFTKTGNSGSGLGREFGKALHNNLNRLLFGEEQVTRSSHLEKLCLIRDGVGRDNISDFTTNLIKHYLCEYTETFAIANISEDRTKRLLVAKAKFNYETESWEAREYTLPWHRRDFVLLTPKALLTRDETWINKSDLIKDFESIPAAIPDAELRAQVNNYFRNRLGRNRKQEPSATERSEAAVSTIHEFPVLVDFYIKIKEDAGEQATSLSSQRVRRSEALYVTQFKGLLHQLAATDFYSTAGRTYAEAHARVAFLKDVIENKGGHRFFYTKEGQIQREEDVQILYRLTWFGTPSDVTREANDGRGPADFKISRGAKDKTIVEFKLASNKQLKRNLEKQAEIYMAASDANRAIKVIFYFSLEELLKTRRVLESLGIQDGPDIVLVDARRDNKPSGSKA